MCDSGGNIFHSPPLCHFCLENIPAARVHCLAVLDKNLLRHIDERCRRFGCVATFEARPTQHRVSREEKESTWLCHVPAHPAPQLVFVLFIFLEIGVQTVFLDGRLLYIFHYCIC